MHIKPKVITDFRNQDYVQETSRHGNRTIKRYFEITHQCGESSLIHSGVLIERYYFREQILILLINFHIQIIQAYITGS